MRKSIRLLLLACLVLAAPSLASAASLVYIDDGRDIAVARPDGSLARKVTHTTDPNNGFKAVSVADDGGITAFLTQSDGSGNATFVVVDQNGATLKGPFLFERDGLCGGLSPFVTATSPDGNWVAAHYWKGSNNCVGGSYTPSVRLISRNSPTLGTSTYPSFDYLLQPHWIRHPDARLAGINGGTISVWQNDATNMASWVALPVGSPYQFSDFDFHPTDTRVLIDLGPASGTGVQPHRLELYSYTEFSTGAAAPTDPNPQLICALDDYVSNDTGGGHPSWSPDGTQIAWHSSDGIYVSPAPVASGGTCVLQPKLVVPGGGVPRWARFDVAASAPGPGPGPGPGPTPVTPQVAFTGAKLIAASRAFTVQMRMAAPATVTLTVYRVGRAAALGRITISAKTGLLKRRITAVKGKRLRPGRYRVVIRSGKTVKTLVVRVK